MTKHNIQQIAGCLLAALAVTGILPIALGTIIENAGAWMLPIAFTAFSVLMMKAIR